MGIHDVYMHTSSSIYTCSYKVYSKTSYSTGF